MASPEAALLLSLEPSTLALLEAGTPAVLLAADGAPYVPGPAAPPRGLVLSVGGANLAATATPFGAVLRTGDGGCAGVVRTKVVVAAAPGERNIHRAGRRVEGEVKRRVVQADHADSALASAYDRARPKKRQRAVAEAPAHAAGAVARRSADAEAWHKRCVLVEGIEMDEPGVAHLLCKFLGADNVRWCGVSPDFDRGWTRGGNLAHWWCGRLWVELGTAVLARDALKRKRKDCKVPLRGGRSVSVALRAPSAAELDGLRAAGLCLAGPASAHKGAQAAFDCVPPDARAVLHTAACDAIREQHLMVPAMAAGICETLRAATLALALPAALGSALPGIAPTPAGAAAADLVRGLGAAIVAACHAGLASRAAIDSAGPPSASSGSDSEGGLF